MTVEFDKDPAFTLVEVVIGIFVVLVTLVSVSAVFTLQDRAFHRYRDSNMIQFVVRSEMEALLAHGFGGIPGQLGSFPKTVQVERLVDGHPSTTNFIVEATFTLRADDETAEVVVTVNHEQKPEISTELRTALYKTS